jgi:hypothetical protein
MCCIATQCDVSRVIFGDRSGPGSCPALVFIEEEGGHASRCMLMLDPVAAIAANMDKINKLGQSLGRMSAVELARFTRAPDFQLSQLIKALEWPSDDFPVMLNGFPPEVLEQIQIFLWKCFWRWLTSAVDCLPDAQTQKDLTVTQLLTIELPREVNGLRITAGELIQDLLVSGNCTCADDPEIQNLELLMSMIHAEGLQDFFEGSPGLNS